MGDPSLLFIEGGRMSGEREGGTQFRETWETLEVYIGIRYSHLLISVFLFVLSILFIHSFTYSFINLFTYSG